jgi:hypothetical protein
MCTSCVLCKLDCVIHVLWQPSPIKVAVDAQIASLNNIKQLLNSARGCIKMLLGLASEKYIELHVGVAAFVRDEHAPL